MASGDCRCKSGRWRTGRTARSSGCSCTCSPTCRATATRRCASTSPPPAEASPAPSEPVTVARDSGWHRDWHGAAVLPRAAPGLPARGGRTLATAEPLWSEHAFGGFTLQCNGQTLTTASGPVELEMEEAGPLRAVVLVRGKHRRADGSGYMDFRRPHHRLRRQALRRGRAPVHPCRGRAESSAGRRCAWRCSPRPAGSHAWLWAKATTRRASSSGADASGHGDQQPRRCSTSPTSTTATASTATSGLTGAMTRPA